ncbi:MAG: putative glycoside hydrolase [bacterium]|nr:putative glycoside hydrolase [bacterium]
MINLPKSKFTRLLKQNPRRYIMQGVIFLVVVGLIFCFSYFTLPALFTVSYEESKTSVTISTKPEKKEAGFVATHIPTPAQVKAIYMTSCVAGTTSFRNSLVKLIEETEINSVVIDIKDFTGTLSFISENPTLKAMLSTRCYAPDMKDFIESLHKKGIYVIGRIAVFQDVYLVKERPELAVKRKSDGGIWKDYKGLSFTDPGSKDVWDHTVLISKESYAAGFDELNFDYIRFPSDGNMKDISFPFSGNKSKPEVLRGFFAYLNKELKPIGAVLSADLFGMTTTNTDDLNIGQVLEHALPYFDYIAPMVYPSHYPTNFMGFAKPAAKPYEVVKFSMDVAVKRTVATTTVVAMFGEQPISTTTKPFLYRKKAFDARKIRPWLQDFNLGATYTPEMVRAQIQATYDSGLDSWMLWNASNRYTAAALHEAEVESTAKAE